MSTKKKKTRWPQQRNVGDIHKIRAEYKGKPRKEAVADFRLKTGHNCLAANVREIGLYESPINIVVAFGFYYRCCYVYIMLSAIAYHKICILYTLINTGVRFIVSPSTATVTACPGGCRCCTGVLISP